MDIRRHLSFANVASATALALVLGSGVAVAAGLAPNSVGSKQIKPQAVKSAHLKNRTIQGKDLKNNAVKGKHIKESTLASVPAVDTVVTSERATSAIGATPTTVATLGTFTITLRCVDAGGGVTRSFLEIRTSVDNASFFAETGDFYPDFDVFSGPQVLAETNDNNPDIQQALFVAAAPDGTMYQGFGYTSHRLNGSAGCAAQLTFIG